jgi:HK97 family phage major capsid protein
VTPGELMDLYHALRRGDRLRAAWLMHDNTKKAIRKIVTGVSGDVTFVWQPGLQSGEPDTLLGQPVYTSPDMATMAASAKTILFGNFSYYWIVERQNIAFQRLNELYAVSAGQVGFRIARRLDGKLTLATAVYHLIQHS